MVEKLTEAVMDISEDLTFHAERKIRLALSIVSEFNDQLQEEGNCGRRRDI